MWNEIFVEKKIAAHPRAQAIASRIGKKPIEISRYDDFWGRSKKPYLHKRDSLNLFIAKKEGQLLKEAPPAYGPSGEPHYYFIHAYNCIYECQYCYLQGYFNSPDIVLFINHEEIIDEMKSTLRSHNAPVWFHAGEFSDSLALTHLTGELELYHDFCRQNPDARIELRTKSVNTRELERLPPLDNLIVSFSLSPAQTAKRVDHKVPGTAARLKAMEALLNKGWRLAAHFDPMIYGPDFKERYQELLDEMRGKGLLTNLAYLSLGVVRFTKDVHREVERNYPDSMALAGPMVKSFDGKVRYHRPLRMWMMNAVKDLAVELGLDKSRIYLCMEDDA